MADAATLATVDLALVLSVDVSSSVDAGDFRMQMDGIASALRDPSVHNAIALGTNRRIALSLVQWSDAKSQTLSLDWQVLANPQDIEMAAHGIESTERHWRPGGTGLAAAVTYSTALLQTLTFATERRVIDVSGDGEDNEGGDTPAARDQALAFGIIINGLPITYGSHYLLSYYHDQVIGGSGAFLEPAQDMRSFRDAMLRKLLREIGAPIS